MLKKLFVLWMILPMVCFSQQTLDLSTVARDTIAVYPYAEILVDTHNVYTAKTILNPQLKFGAFTQRAVSRVGINSYWVRTRLKSDQGRKWLLEVPDPHIKEIVLYELQGDSLVQIHTGMGFGKKFDQKKYQYKNFLYDINSSTQKPTIYYLHLKTDVVNSFLLKLRNSQIFVKYSLTEYYLLGVYYGLLLMMAVYNFAIYIRVKERVYLFYVLYVVCCALNSFTEDGLGFQFIWPNQPWVNLFLIRWVADLLLFSFLIYSVSFLNLYSQYKKIIWVAYALGVLHVLASYINHTYFYGELNISPLFLTPFAIIYVLGIYNITKGDKSARYFIAGYSFILISLIIFYLRSKGITILHHIVTIYSFNLGFLIEVVVLSYALGERLRTEKSDKELAQQKTIAQLKENEKIRAEYTKELEEEVAERTQDLERANEEIKKFNSFLEAKNLKLEIDVKNISKARVTSKLTSIEEFKEVYGSEEICKEFLANRKWKNKPYKCGKCGCEKDIPHEDYAKRCAKCKYVESATALTIFHGVKIPLPEAFYILYVVYNNKTVTAEELSRSTQVSERSCSVFKKKIQDLEKTTKPKSKKAGWEHLIDLE